MKYADLKAFSDFRELENPEYFSGIPSDWYVVITDIVDSTRAIEAGAYRSVNTLGVGSIVAAQRALGPEPLPFSFGGDGATLVVPERHLQAVLRSLRGLKTLAHQQFDLELRVGAVAVGELVAAGFDLQWARYEVVPGQAIAIFRGGGFPEADRRVRSGQVLEGGPSGQVDLSGMSCRWQAIPSARGCVLSIILSARKEEPGFYSMLLGEIDRSVEGGVETSNPVRLERMSYRGVLECIRDEVRYHGRWSPALIGRMLEIVLAVGIFRYGVPGMFFNARRYAQSLVRHTDYRKFDNALRMTLDCTSEEAERIRALCAREHERGTLFYGIHEDSEAVMTCYLNGLGDGEHLHFVDGGRGGYALAAQDLKLRMEEVAASSP